MTVGATADIRIRDHLYNRTALPFHRCHYQLLENKFVRGRDGILQGRHNNKLLVLRVLLT